MNIYKASSKIRVPPVRFFVGDSESLEDMKRCAKLEEENNDD